MAGERVDGEHRGAAGCTRCWNGLLETLSFESADMAGRRVEIDAEYVDSHLAELASNQDLSRYIL